MDFEEFQKKKEIVKAFKKAVGHGVDLNFFFIKENEVAIKFEPNGTDTGGTPFVQLLLPPLACLGKLTKEGMDIQTLAAAIMALLTSENKDFLKLLKAEVERGEREFKALSEEKRKKVEELKKRLDEQQKVQEELEGKIVHEGTKTVQ